MKVEVRLFATFRTGREKKYFMELDEGTKISDVLHILNIDQKELGILLINGKDGDVQSIIEDSDIIALFPPVGGG